MPGNLNISLTNNNNIFENEESQSDFSVDGSFQVDRITDMLKIRAELLLRQRQLEFVYELPAESGAASHSDLSTASL